MKIEKVEGFKGFKKVYFEDGKVFEFVSGEVPDTDVEYFQVFKDWIKMPKNRAKVIKKLTVEQELKKVKREGKDFNGYQIPFTSDDAVGLLQVKSAFELGLDKTTIHFSNGTKMPITAEDFGDFAKWFVVERAKFFED